MTEVLTQPPATVETGPQPEQMPNALAIDNIDALREKQRKVKWALALDAFGDKDKKDALKPKVAEAINESVRTHLANSGVAEDDPHYQEYYDFLRERSIDKIGDEWDVRGANSISGKKKGISKRQETVYYLHDKYPTKRPNDTDTEPDDEPADSPKTDTKIESKLVNEELNRTQKKYAELLVKRTQKIFERKKARTNESDPVEDIKNIDQAREVFGDYLNAAATQMMLELEAQGLDEAAIAPKIDEFINEQTDKFISTFEEMRAATYKKRSPVIRWALNKWASWDMEGENLSFWQRIKSKENFKNNLKKGAFFAVPGLALGVGVGALVAPAALAVGGGALIAGTIGAGFARAIGRNLATHRLNNVANAETIATKQAAQMRADKQSLQGAYEQSLAGVDFENLSDAEIEKLKTDGEYAGKSLHEALLESIQDRTDYYRKRNRNRFIAGTAISAACGALGAWAGHEWIAPHVTPHLEHATAWAGEKAKEWWGSTHPNGQPTTTPSGGQTPPGTVPPVKPTEAGPPNYDEYGRTPPKAGRPWPDNTGNGNGKELPKFHVVGNDEAHISSGEGWYQTIQEMGISPKHEAALLQEVGPKLHGIKVGDMPLAYQEHGQWFMNMTPDGKMPSSAIKVIAQAAHEHNWHSDYDKFFGHTTAAEHVQADHHKVVEIAHGQDEATITKGEGGLEFADRMGIHDTADQYAVWNQAAPKMHDEGLTYFDKAHNEWRMDMTPDGKMPVSGIQDMAQAAHDQGIHTDYDSAFISHSADTSTGESVTGAGADAHAFTLNEFANNYNSDTKAYYDVLAGVDPAHRDVLLGQAAQELQNFKTDDGKALTYLENGVWHFREVKHLPAAAAKILYEMAEKNHWGLAS